LESIKDLKYKNAYISEYIRRKIALFSLFLEKQASGKRIKHNVNFW
jgi:hypothetical protein